MIGSFMLGLVIGYLTWYAFRPGESTKLINLERIGSLIAILLGATIMTLFPAGSALFDTYGFGLAVGFFLPALNRYFNKRNKESDQKWKERRIEEVKRIRERQALELSEFETKWPEYEKLIDAKLKTVKMYRKTTYGDSYLSENDLQELGLSTEGTQAVLRRYAKEHASEGYEYRYFLWQGQLLKK